MIFKKKKKIQYIIIDKLYNPLNKIILSMINVLLSSSKIITESKLYNLMICTKKISLMINLLLINLYGLHYKINS